MTDADRETQIQKLAGKIEHAMSHARREGYAYFFWRGEADRMRVEMEQLIKSRSHEQVFMLEAKRGLV